MSRLFDILANRITTENGMAAYDDTGSANVNFFSERSGYRDNPQQALADFKAAFKEDPEVAVLNLFNLYDVRGGSGERRASLGIIEYIYNNDYKLFKRIFPLIPMYGRWDALVGYVEDRNVRDYVGKQFVHDLYAAPDQSISLLGKWLPSENSSDHILAVEWAKALFPDAKSYGNRMAQYRRALTHLRNRIGIVETLMSQKRWEDIDYTRVPSRAGMIYRKAFKKNDKSRYENYLESVLNGKAKMNAGVLYPHEIVAKLERYGDNKALNAMWESLPEYSEEPSNVLAVIDVSGSMTSTVYKSVSAIDIAMGLGIYFSERINGMFKDKFITFSERPELVTLKGDNLEERVNNLRQSRWGYNTDLEAVFKLVLKTAKNYDLPESEMPDTILIISDMQFDQANKSNFTAYEMIRAKYAKFGYKLPKLVFWNVTGKVSHPVKHNQEGVILMSGFSPSNLATVLEAKEVTPAQAMLEVLYSKRYQPVLEAIR
jgi:hypothetical protein